MVNSLENKLEGTNLNQIKAMYEKPTAAVFINRESSNEVRKEKGPSAIMTPFNIALKVLAGPIRQQKEINGV